MAVEQCEDHADETGEEYQRPELHKYEKPKVQKHQLYTQVTGVNQGFSTVSSSPPPAPGPPAPGTPFP